MLAIGGKVGRRGASSAGRWLRRLFYRQGVEVAQKAVHNGYGSDGSEDGYQAAGPLNPFAMVS